jgi:hypothetical protein
MHGNAAATKLSDELLREIPVRVRIRNKNLQLILRHLSEGTRTTVP